MVKLMNRVRSVICGVLALTSARAQSEHVVAPPVDWSDPVTITVTGNPTYFHRHQMEVEEVSAEEQAIYQSSWAGAMGLRIAGLANKRYRVHLAYTEMDMNAPTRRWFDILINGEVVQEDVCIFNEVGNRRVLSFDFITPAKDGAITFSQRISRPGSDAPSFTLLRLYDLAGGLVAERSAYAMRPADWDLRGYLDKIYFGPIKDDHDLPPWEGTYKIREHETAKLTPADVIGPDGIAYPNWTQVGLPNGIPTLPVTLSAADFGAVPNDDDDDSTALQEAIEALRVRGGGVLFIPEGIYYLDQPITIKGDNMVLRGAGSGRTRLISRFSMEGAAPEIHGVAEGGEIGIGNFYYGWSDPENLVTLEVRANGKRVKEIASAGPWERTILRRFTGVELLATAGPGKVKLEVIATYRDGAKRSTQRNVRVVDHAVAGDRAAGVLSMIMFRGEGVEGETIALASDGRRGDMSLELTAGHGVKVGDRLVLDAPNTPRWQALHRDDHPGGSYRRNMYEVTAVEGNRVWIPEALRIEFPTIDGAYVQKFRPQVHCGLEDLGFEQAVDADVYSVVFEYGWESWVRGVEVVMTGNKALYMPNSKRCEVRDSVFDRSWTNEGGHAYIGWEHSYDCLMENVTTYDMRHAPVLQWSSSGNVIRDSTFHNSDAQWHAGWTNENLFEGLIVESSQDGGSYGNGMWSSGPEDTGHGPNGPRNVVYNCNITSSKVGLWMGGMNEAWLILYNRFVVGRGPAVLAKAASFDHIIQGNVFITLEPYPAAIYIGSRDCIGIELINNRFYGPIDQLVGGPGRPAVEFDNRILKSGDVNRPHAPVRSIFAWQQENREDILAEQQEQSTRRGR